ncbi:MAG: hypothetical protein FWF02_09040 [Micrococcales bacterium]|nr:hypothetical protein [Micrococcales bacterium]
MNAVARQLIMVHAQGETFVQRARGRTQNEDRGQATVEYIGIVVAIVAFVGAVAVFIKGELAADVQSALREALNTVITENG